MRACLLTNSRAYSFLWDSSADLWTFTHLWGFYVPTHNTSSLQQQRASPATTFQTGWMQIWWYGCQWYETSGELLCCPIFGETWTQESHMGAACDNCWYCKYITHECRCACWFQMQKWILILELHPFMLQTKTTMKGWASSLGMSDYDVNCSINAWIEVRMSVYSGLSLSFANEDSVSSLIWPRYYHAVVFQYLVYLDFFSTWYHLFLCAIDGVTPQNCMCTETKILWISLRASTPFNLNYNSDSLLRLHCYKACTIPGVDNPVACGTCHLLKY